MRAATIVNGQIEIHEHPDLCAGTGQLLIRVKAAGLNGADMLQLSGKYPVPAGAPADIPGLEYAGEVLANGPGAERFKVGDKVMGITVGGGQAEQIVVHEREAMPVPEGLDWAQAGALPEVFTTAHDAVFTQGKLAPGERLLVHGAAGGVGMAAVQLGVLFNAGVVAAVRSEAVRSDVAALGATVIDPEDQFAHGPYNVILELVGANNLIPNLASLAKRGRIALIGITGGAGTAPFDFRALMKCSGTIFGSSLRSRPLEEKAATARLMETQVLPFFVQRRLHVPVHASFPLREAAAAYDAYRTRGKFGKIVLIMD